MGNNLQKHLAIRPATIEEALKREIEVLKSQDSTGTVRLEKLKRILGRNIPTTITNRLLTEFGQLEYASYYLSFDV